MERCIARSLAVALTAVGLTGCAESLAPPEPLATASSPAFSISGTVTGSVTGAVICTPCPPGMMCATVCDSSTPIGVALPPDGDAEETDVTIILAPPLASDDATQP